jgi:SAM-dependent methyltransferase
MRAAGKEVTCIDLGLSHYASQSGGGARIEGDFLELDLAGPFDCVWASHVLEHQLNPNLFLRKVHSLLREGGVLAITVPPLKHDIVGGHLALWNPGLLLYHLVIAGFDCREAALRQYGYNITCLLVKKSIQLPELHMDTGDIERLKPFFPEGVEEPFDGRIPELNWPRAATGKAV